MNLRTMADMKERNRKPYMSSQGIRAQKWLPSCHSKITVSQILSQNLNSLFGQTRMHKLPKAKDLSRIACQVSEGAEESERRELRDTLHSTPGRV
jgi:hypothetical protein